MEYILFIHDNVDSAATQQQWDAFITKAKNSDVFLGGSEIANSTAIGSKPVPDITNTIGGFMRFESDDKGKILELLETHPVVIQGGTVELCEMPKS